MTTAFCNLDIPDITITRPQTMVFTVSGIYDKIKSIEEDVKEEYKQAN